MSEAGPDICDADVLLMELAQSDMALVRHVQAIALRTTEPETLNGLVRSAQRLARSVRTTLTTRAKLAKERADADRADGREQQRRQAAAEFAQSLVSRMTFPPEGEVEDVGEAEADFGYEPQDELEAAARARIRLEYEPAEADAIEHELPGLIFGAWTKGGYARMLPQDRLTRAMALVHKTFGPSKTLRPEPDPVCEPPEPSEPPPAEAPAPPELEPPPPEPPPPEPPPEEPYIPPWERLRPGQRFPGGSGW